MNKVLLIYAVFMQLAICSESLLVSETDKNLITRIVIRTGGLCCRIVENEKIVLEINDKEQILQFINGVKYGERIAGEIVFPDGRRGKLLNCACCGEYTIEIYQDKMIKFAGSVHGFGRIRSHWINDNYDTSLTDKSGEYLKKILKIENDNGPNQSLKGRM